MFEGTEGIRGSIPHKLLPLLKMRSITFSYAELVNFHLAEGSHSILSEYFNSEPSTLSSRNNIDMAQKESSGKL